jgi:hypothetical protein
MAVVLAVAALGCWLGKPGASPIAPPTAARVAAGVALAEQSPTARPFGSESVTGPSGGAYYARAIETIQTGQRVLARNPGLAGGELPDAAVDRATWVNIRLRMPKPTGDFLEITVLRPVEWLAEHLAQAAALDGEYPRALAEARGTNVASGSTTVSSVMPTDDPPEPSPGMIEPITADSITGSPWIFLTLHELEAVGPAEIDEVGPCPELETGEGRLVTGTFAHQSGEVFDIAVDGLTEPIGCTGAHPFWSEDRHAFIPARDLRPGETLRTESGTLRQITRITPRRGPPVPVFNVEVDAEHVYFVSVDGVLVHNAYTGTASKCVESVDEFLKDGYDTLSRRTDLAGQAHHLNQTAAFWDVIPSSQGSSIKLQGNILTDAGAPHTRAHQSLEEFWNQYRGTDIIPTNLEYTRALQHSLRLAGLTESQVQQAVRAAIRERVEYGLLGGIPVPRVPGSIRNLAR